ncbi:ATP-binding cassette domain-containing protein [Cytobacillus sp. FSL K6-0129]
MTHSILIKNMSFQYHSMDKRIFSDVNVSIDEHWKLALLGRNGRGKTTFMNILTNKLQYRGTIQTPLTFKYFPAFPL